MGIISLPIPWADSATGSWFLVCLGPVRRSKQRAQAMMSKVPNKIHQQIIPTMNQDRGRRHCQVQNDTGAEAANRSDHDERYYRANNKRCDGRPQLVE